MNHRTLKTLTGATPQPGTGILRPFPSPQLRHIDPFVFLDTGTPKNLGTREIYVPPHAHRGVQPVSLLFRGRIEHRDSLGNHRTITSGGIQWLVSGTGALHEEVLQGDEQGVFHMAQLWINVPSALKQIPPAHYAVSSNRVPKLTSLGQNSTLRLYAGTVGEHQGPAPMPTPVLVAHLTIGAGGNITIPIPKSWNAACTVVAGNLSLKENTRLTPGDTPVFHKDGTAIFLHSSSGGEALLMCGQPIAEPVAMGGGFVMNNRQEILQAFTDYRNGTMGSLAASR